MFAYKTLRTLKGKKYLWEIHYQAVEIDLTVIALTVRIPFWITKESHAAIKERYDSALQFFKSIDKPKKKAKKKADK